MTTHTKIMAAVIGLTVTMAFGLSESSANPIVVNSFDNGWYFSSGGAASHTPTNTNIFTGRSGSNIYHHFQAFDLSAASGQFVTSATLTYVGGNGGYASSDSSETVGWFDYTGDITSLLAGTGGLAAHSDLASGASYGSAVVSGPGSMPAIVASLTAAALADLNAAITSIDQRFVIGAALTSLAGGGIQQILWSSSVLLPASSLTLTFGAPPPPPPGVPAPGALALLGLGLFGLAARRSAS